ncbi:hypothetical protein G6F48_011864 [Rhizopus delemar]|nr:hypothetical protein G6F48_011864 [Rhizopus delemar]
MTLFLKDVRHSSGLPSIMHILDCLSDVLSATVTRQYSTIYSTYPVHHLHGQHVTDDMLTMFGQSESQITEAMEVDSSTNLEEIDDNGEAIDFDNVDLDLDDNYEDQFNKNVDALRFNNLSNLKS